MDWTSLTASSTSAGSIANWILHTSVQAESANIIAEAESIIYRRLRHFKMLTPSTGTFTTSQVTLTLPSDYLEDKSFYITGTAYTKLTRKPMQEVIASYCYDGSGNRVITQPNIFFNDQSNFQFDSPADQIYPWLLYYYQQPAPLSSTNTSNFLTATYPRLMRAACMTQASEFMKDSGQGNYDRTYWVQMTQAEIEAAQQESDRSERSLEAGMILV